jgi:hypothetical protein
VWMPAVGVLHVRGCVPCPCQKRIAAQRISLNGQRTTQRNADGMTGARRDTQRTSLTVSERSHLLTEKNAP